MVVTIVAVAAAVIGALVVAFYIGETVGRQRAMSRSPRGESRPEVIEETAESSRVPAMPTVGACGVTGCPNLRPHSLVADLCRRVKERDQG